MQLATMKRQMRRLDRRIRQQLVAQILTNASPHFYDSGYLKSRIGEPHVYTRLFAFPRPYKLPEGPIDDRLEVIAITEDGICYDAFGGGACMLGFDELAIESLQKLVKLSERINLVKATDN